MEITIDVAFNELEFRESVVKETSRRLAVAMKEEVREIVKNAVSAQIDSQVGEIIKGLIDAPIQKTNCYGEPTGQARTLRQEIVDHAKEWLSTKVNERGEANSYSDRCQTRAEWIARTAASGILGAELKDECKKIIDGVKTEAKAKMAALVADALSKMSTLKL